MPLGDEHRARREEGLQGVRNILWAVGGGGAAAIAGGFTREDFMNEAFLHMTAAEQVFLDEFFAFFFLLFYLFFIFITFYLLKICICHYLLTF